MSEIDEYSVWAGMMSRCYNKKEKAYKRYGGRGIIVCDRWLGDDGFKNFFADMGKRPSSKHEIDRFPDNNGDYKPGNCRWTTGKENCRNKRNNHRLLFDGKNLTLTEWAEKTGVSFDALKMRIKRGWSVKKTLTTPIRKSSGFFHEG